MIAFESIPNLKMVERHGTLVDGNFQNSLNQD